MKDDKKEELPRLIRWSNDGYPPLDLAKEFRAVIELIKYSKYQQAKISHLEELLKAADEVIHFNQIKGEGITYMKALEKYQTLKNKQ